ncbi:hypothetical protein SAMN05192588_1084 [Nonlabens sp. Hel1_33_55]|uniref:GldL-related protein n=1 Tax=Nonlabens sp. Hel1_33_55 TaxID=1336802 RepID=UPI000875B7FB|nr:hypothetical protein [Nonlabens sp. Hel1_33_55]SCY08926.1 hypothetical protein SAMN05192588_1084 [Nonlabens sp. Hel1_33_55]
MKVDYQKQKQLKESLNYKGIIFILITAIFLIIVGALFKIMHWGFGAEALVNGNTILAAGLILKVVALIWFMISLLTAKKKLN